jgi:hypothetical protein
VSGGTGIVSKRMAPPFDELPFSASSWRLAIRCRAQQRLLTVTKAIRNDAILVVGIFKAF